MVPASLSLRILNKYLQSASVHNALAVITILQMGKPRLGAASCLEAHRELVAKSGCRTVP